MYIHANNHQLIGGQSPSLFDWHFVFWTHPASTKEPTEAMIYHIFFGKSLSRTILISKGVIQWFKICIKNERAIHLTSQSPLPRNVFFILPRILKARKNLFFCRYSNIENNFFLEKSDILYILKIPENVSNAKFKRCSIVHVELYKVCKKKINSFPYL